MTATLLTGPGRISQILWGERQQSTLTFGYPMDLDVTKFHRQPRGASEMVNMNDQQETTVLGRDYYMTCRARHLDLAAWASLQDFLDWAANGGSFAVVPDAVNAPLYALPGCFLVQPFTEPDVMIEDEGTQMIELVIRNPTYDLGLAWR